MPKISRNDAARLLGQVPQEHIFHCCDGRTIHTMSQLRDELGQLGNDVFGYHLNQKKNDFSNWVRDIIGDHKLANDLKKATSQAKARKAVAQRVDFLSAKV